MSFEIVKGDLFDPAHGFYGLAQGVNTYGVMGAGIAVPFREKWPEMYEDYHKICKRYGVKLAGTLHAFDIPANNGATIYNLFSQDLPGPNGNYRWLEQAAIAMVMDAEKKGHPKVGLPWIGCGIAGLARHNVKVIFEDILGPSAVEFVLVEQ